MGVKFESYAVLKFLKNYLFLRFLPFKIMIQSNWTSTKFWNFVNEISLNSLYKQVFLKYLKTWPIFGLVFLHILIPHKIGRWVLVDILMLNQNMKKNKCENRTSFEIFEKNPFIQAVQRNFINKILKFYKKSVALNHYFEW